MARFSEPNLATALEIIGRYPVAKSATIPLLHLAPERLMGAPATRESDVWELAFTLQRWFCPGSPYESDQLAVQIDQVVRGRRRALTGRYAGIDEIVAAALAPTPGDRPRPAPAPAHTEVRPRVASDVVAAPSAEPIA